MKMALTEVETRRAEKIKMRLKLSVLLSVLIDGIKYKPLTQGCKTKFQHAQATESSTVAPKNICAFRAFMPPSWHLEF
jgi:hypothetical protein